MLGDCPRQGRELGGKLLLESHSAAASASVPLGKVPYGTLESHIEVARVTPQPELLEVFVSVNSIVLRAFFFFF